MGCAVVCGLRCIQAQERWTYILLQTGTVMSQTPSLSVHPHPCKARCSLGKRVLALLSSMMAKAPFGWPPALLCMKDSCDPLVSLQLHRKREM